MKLPAGLETYLDRIQTDQSIPEDIQNNFGLQIDGYILKN